MSTVAPRADNAAGQLHIVAGRRDLTRKRVLERPVDTALRTRCTSRCDASLVNAAHPPRAYAEALDVAGAQHSSYGREAAGVMAACVIVAMPVATAESVVNTALALARDGTREAIAVAVEAAGTFSHWTDAVASGALRAAVAAYDTVGTAAGDTFVGYLAVALAEGRAMGAAMRWAAAAGALRSSASAPRRRCCIAMPWMRLLSRRRPPSERP